MLKYFSDKIHFTYPWEKYTQVAVSDYMFGGMENLQRMSGAFGGPKGLGKDLNDQNLQRAMDLLMSKKKPR